MKIKTLLLLLVSHGGALAIGFAAGIYALPILTAPAAPSSAQVTAVASEAAYSAQFRRDLEDSDALHWGEGEVFIGSDSISFEGALAPGPDYKLYLSPDFVETEAEFIRLKSKMVAVGDIKTFNNFLIELPDDIDPADYSSVIVWCESFSQFITSASYQ